MGQDLAILHYTQRSFINLIDTLREGERDSTSVKLQYI
jgi:hypothetical protein